MVIEPCAVLDSSCRYRGDSVGSGTTAILVAGASPGGRSAPGDGGGASAAPNSEAPTTSRIFNVIFFSAAANPHCMRPQFSSLIIELIQQSDAAARIVFRSGADHGGGAVAQSRLQLQMLGQVHVRLYLTDPRGALLGLDIDALGNVPPGFDAGAGILGAPSPYCSCPRRWSARSSPRLFCSLTRGLRPLPPPTPLNVASAAPTCASCRAVSCAPDTPNSRRAMISSWASPDVLVKANCGASA